MVLLYVEARELKKLEKLLYRLSHFTKNIIICLRIIFDTSILEKPINIIKCQFENHTYNKHCALFKVQKLCDFKREKWV